MIIHKKLFKFLEVLYLHSLDFKKINESELRKLFKNNEYYNLKYWCLENNLLIIEHKHVEITVEGIYFFNFLKKLRKI